MTSFATRLHDAIQKKGTPALVGIDPRFDQLPEPVVMAAGMRRAAERQSMVAGAFEEFCFRLIDVVAPLVPAVKPQAAFFEACGPAGTRVLARVIRRARDQGLVVICDAKRGDIGSTAEAYADAYLAGEDPDAAPWAADALTVNPYLGDDTLQPFVKTANERGAGLYVLVRTSNPGSASFQNHGESDDGTNRLYQKVGQTVEQLSVESAAGESYGSIGAVVGATYPEELKELRELMPHTPLLVPGYGSQGGGAEDVRAAFDANGLGAVINSSRGINFAHKKAPYAEEFGDARWEEAVEAATKQMIADLATVLPG